MALAKIYEGIEMTIQETESIVMPARRVVVAASDLFGMLNLQSELEMLGTKVVGCAADGAQAVRATQMLNPEVVILDQGLTGVDTFEAAEAIHADRIAPVVVLVSPGQKDVLKKRHATNIAAFLTKPLHQADVIPAIEIAVAKWSAVREMEQRIAKLKRQLETREVVDSAKCMLMEKYSWREAEAYRYMQAISMNTRKPMSVIAQRILSGSTAVVAVQEKAVA